MPRPSGIQRAFSLARNGDGMPIPAIKQRLRDEGYDVEQIMSPVVVRQLRRILIDTRRERWKRKLAPRVNHGPRSGRTGQPDKLH